MKLYESNESEFNLIWNKILQNNFEDEIKNQIKLELKGQCTSLLININDNFHWLETVSDI